ncbi:30S ribosomal protein S2 [Deltaproteobacteria bacterium TL4]
MTVVSMKHLIEAGVHLGHQTRRWHPKMGKYIYGSKSGIHIIDLRKTMHELKIVYEYVRDAAAEGKEVLFVGTKPQIQEVIKAEAQRCNSAYINFRWLGGLLTNFSTIKQSIARLKSYEELMGEDGSYPGILKKEALRLENVRIKLERSLGGVKNMKSFPHILFIVDCKKERIAIQEAHKLDIPIISIVDTNCDPRGITFTIPGNDDSPRAVELFANVIAVAVLEGRTLFDARRKEDAINDAGEKTQGKEKRRPGKEPQRKMIRKSVSPDAEEDVSAEDQTPSTDDEVKADFDKKAKPARNNIVRKASSSKPQESELSSENQDPTEFSSASSENLDSEEEGAETEA